VLRVRNLTRQAVLAERAALASTFGTRLKGLLGTRALAPSEGLVLDPCNSIHMFFMSYAIDVAFLSRESEVVGVVHEIAPWHLTRVYWKARVAVELPAGVLSSTGTCVGDRLALEAVA